MEYYDVDVYAREVTTTSPEAQLWFNRGLVWCFAYFHDEAVACFRNALSADPSCAMAFWGVAYATGPNYNLPWELRDENMRRDLLAAAYDATQAALALADAATPPERALIEALPARFPQREPEGLDVMRGWNDAFADTMREVHEHQSQNRLPRRRPNTTASPASVKAGRCASEAGRSCHGGSGQPHASSNRAASGPGSGPSPPRMRARSPTRGGSSSYPSSCRRRRKPRRSYNASAGSFPSSTSSETSRAPAALAASTVASSTSAPSPRRRYAGSVPSPRTLARPSRSAPRQKLAGWPSTNAANDRSWRTPVSAMYVARAVASSRAGSA